MTFPLGSLRIERSDDAALPARIGTAPSWWSQLALLVGAVVWVLAVIALATHSSADPGFSTSGSGGPVQNNAGVAGAWLSDLAFFLVGYSVWWAVLVGGRTWLSGLARVLRGTNTASSVPPETPRTWPIWLGLALLLMARGLLE